MELLNAIKEMILQLGLVGVFGATALEYGCFPISSEILLPFIGYAVSVGGFPLFGAILAATLGGIVGSSACYWIGRAGGSFFERLALRFETIALGVNQAQKIFLRYGKQSVFLARLFPIARTYISFPAGLARMPFVSFLVYTTAGAFLWNAALIGAGYYLGNHWEVCKLFLLEYKWILCIAILLVIFAVWKLREKKKSSS